MGTKKNVAVVAGGYTSEAEISLKSAKTIIEHLDADLFVPYLVTISRQQWLVHLPSQNQTVPINKNNFTATLPTGQALVFNLAYITIHGTPGEDGLLQGYFEMLQIPYCACTALVAAITFDKQACKTFLASSGVAMAPSVLVLPGQQTQKLTEIEKLGYPLFIKPNAGGSSFGTTKVTQAQQIMPALQAALAEGPSALAEGFISGREVTCGVYQTKTGLHTLPVTEIVTKTDFFDYDAKYNPELCDEITPAQLPQNIFEEVQRISQHLYRFIGCRGIVRFDYIIQGGVPYFLEVNTTPGMSPASIIPQQVRAAGGNLTTVLTQVINMVSQA